MRPLFFLVLIFLVASCNNNQQENNKGASDNPDQSNISEENKVDDDVNKDTTDIFVASDFSTLTLEGKIDDKFPIIVEIKNNDGRISGEVIYKKIGTPIVLEGKFGSNNAMKWSEIFDGKNGAIYDGILTKTDFTGTWHDQEKGQEFPFNLKVTDSDFADYNKLDVSGVYELGTKGSKNGHGIFAVQKMNNTKLKFFFFKMGNAPAHNQGNLTGNAVLKANSATYSDVDDEWQCEFDMNFSTTQLKVSSNIDASNCGFGHNIYVDGAYQKTKTKFDFDKLAAEYGMD